MKTIFSNVAESERTTDLSVIAGFKNDETGTTGDFALLQAISMGDRYAFSCFYDRHAKLLSSVVRRILNDKQATEEVLQQVFEEIWDKAGSYHSGWGRPVTWAVAVAHNKAIEVNRTRWSRSPLLPAHPRTIASIAQARQRSMN